MELVIQIMNWLALIVPTLIGTGMLVKYLPFLRNVSNHAIPLLNALVAFLTMFGGAAAVANAGIFGDIGGFLSVPAKAMAALLISYLTSALHDKVLKPLLPKGPSPA